MDTDLQTLLGAVAFLAQTAAELQASGSPRTAQEREALMRTVKAARKVLASVPKKPRGLAAEDPWSKHLATVGIIGKDLTEIEREIVAKTSERLSYNVSAVGQALNIARSPARRYIEALKREPAEAPRSPDEPAQAPAPAAPAQANLGAEGGAAAARGTPA